MLLKIRVQCHIEQEIFESDRLSLIIVWSCQCSVKSPSSKNLMSYGKLYYQRFTRDDMSLSRAATCIFVLSVVVVYASNAFAQHTFVSSFHDLSYPSSTTPTSSNVSLVEILEYRESHYADGETSHEALPASLAPQLVRCIVVKPLCKLRPFGVLLTQNEDDPWCGL